MAAVAMAPRAVGLRGRGEGRDRVSTMTAEQGAESLARLVEEISALAEHARLHGPSPDCAARMDAIMARHRARIEAARHIESEPSPEPSHAN